MWITKLTGQNVLGTESLKNMFFKCQVVWKIHLISTAEVHSGLCVAPRGFFGGESQSFLAQQHFLSFKMKTASIFGI